MKTSIAICAALLATASAHAADNGLTPRETLKVRDAGFSIYSDPDDREVNKVERYMRRRGLQRDPNYVGKPMQQPTVSYVFTNSRTVFERKD